MEDPGPADFSFIFGNPEDKPFVGDFNNDGIDTIGLHRESTGIVYFRQTNTTGVADASSSTAILMTGSSQVTGS